MADVIFFVTDANLKALGYWPRTQITFRFAGRCYLGIDRAP